jgi:hypothetical protein
VGRGQAVGRGEVAAEPVLDAAEEWVARLAWGAASA